MSCLRRFGNGKRSSAMRSGKVYTSRRSSLADHLVMHDGRLEFEQEIAVLGIVLRALDRRAGKRADRIEIPPAGQRDEVRLIADLALEDLHAEIAGHAAVVGDRVRVEELAVRG